MLEKIRAFATRPVSFRWTLAIAVSGVAGIALYHCWPGSWIEAHPGTASWVQAIGTIGAILVAFYAPRIESWFKYQSELEQQCIIDQSALKKFLPALAAVEHELSQSQNRLMTGWPYGWPKSRDLAAAYLNRLRITVPIEFEFIDQWRSPVSFDISSAIQSLAHRVVQFNSTIARLSDSQPAKSTSEWEARLKEIAAAHSLLLEAIASYRDITESYGVTISTQSKIIDRS